MPQPPEDPSALIARLQRATDALAPGTPPAPPAPPAPPSSPAKPAIGLGGGGMALAVALVAMAIATGQTRLIIPALLIGIAAGVALLLAAGRKVVVDPALAQVGMGADIGEGARLEPGSKVGAGASVGKGVHLEPGAAVGMGATVGAGAVLKRNATVRAGATVGAEVVLEEGAVVSSGADVGRGATVGHGARVGTGATVGKGAYVPPGTVVRTGSMWNNTDRSAAPPKTSPAPLPAADPRAARIDAGCAKLEAEIQQAPPQAREYLGASISTVRALRETCHGLLRREQVLRAETSAEAMAELEAERAALQKRLESVTDEHVRRSLASAVAAIDEQKRQRELMARTADRLDAELTRLLWTMDGMGAQLVRLRTAGAEVGATGDLEAARGVKKLQDEIGAIADALEEIAAVQRAEIIPVSDVGGDGSAFLPAGQRERG